MTTDTVEIRTDVPPSMHPDVLTPFEGALAVQGTPGLAAYAAGREALTAMYTLYGDIQEASRALRNAAAPARRRQQPSGRSEYTENIRLFGSALTLVHGREAELAQAVHRAATRVFEAVDRRAKEIGGHADALRERVRVALEDPARKSAEGLSLAAEARAHVRGLSRHERLRFAVAAAEGQDLRTVSAILAAQPFLSGLTGEDHSALHDTAAGVFAAQAWGQLHAVESVAERVARGRDHVTKKYDEIMRLGDTASARAASKLKTLAEGAR